MSSKGRKLTSLVLLLAFLSVLVFIDLFHTDTGTLKDTSCPACHFQNSSIGISYEVVIELPDLVFLGLMDGVVSSDYEASRARSIAARSPPQL
jgi:hypothetical protein